MHISIPHHGDGFCFSFAYRSCESSLHWWNLINLSITRENRKYSSQASSISSIKRKLKRGRWIIWSISSLYLYLGPGEKQNKSMFCICQVKPYLVLILVKENFTGPNPQRVQTLFTQGLRIRKTTLFWLRLKMFPQSLKCSKAGYLKDVYVIGALYTSGSFTHPLHS